ncbi:MAG: Cellulophaga phage phi46:3 [Bacteroidota bacterium]|jgi:hypothetical protein
MPKTISHSEENKGWTSFWNFVPDWFIRLNSNFLTIKEGQLWLHNDINNLKMNVLYGVKVDSKIKTVINEAMIEDKIFKTLVLESDEKWEAVLTTNLTNGVIKASEFNTRESRQFSFIRGNEEGGSLQGNAAQGIGTITNVTGNQITFGTIPDLVNVGDLLFQINGSLQQLIGVIQGINKTTNVITVASITTAPQVGFYSYAQKNSRIEGEEMRGYFMEVELINTTDTNSELFGVSTNAVKSYV